MNRKLAFFTAAALASASLIVISKTSYSANILNFANDCEPNSIDDTKVETIAEASRERKEDCLLPDIQSRNSAIIDLALTIKTSADEQFLAGATEAANSSYAKASMILGQINSLNSVLGQPIGANSEFELLNADIGFRLQLLKAGADFWGTGFLNHPANPVKLMSELQLNFVEFGKVVGEINHFQAISKDTDIQQATIRALYNEASSEAQAELWVVDQSSSRVRSSDQTKEYLFQRLIDNSRRQEEIKIELDEVWNEVDKLGDQISNIALNAAAQAAGIQPGIASAVISGEGIEDRLKIVGVELLSDSIFMKELISASSEITELYEAAAIAQEYYSELEDILGSVTEIKSVAEPLYDGFRNGFKEENLVNMVKVGSTMLSQLKEEEIDSILVDVDKLVSDGTIEFEEVLEIAGLKEDFQTSIDETISSMIGADISEVAEKFLSKTTSNVSAFEAIKLVASQQAELPEDLKVFAVHAILSMPVVRPFEKLLGKDEIKAVSELSNPNSTTKYLDALRREFEEKIGARISESRPELLLAAVSQALESKVLQVDFAFDANEIPTVKIKLGEQEFDISEGLSKKTFDASVQVQSYLQSKSDSVSALFEAENFDELLRKQITEVIKSSPISNAAELTKKLLSAKLVSYGDIVSHLATTGEIEISQVEKEIKESLLSAGSNVLMPLAELMVGQNEIPMLLGQVNNADVKKSSGIELPDLLPEIKPSPRRGTSEVVSPEEQVAAMIVANTVPGGVFVAAALGAAKALGQMNLAIQKGNELYNEDKNLLKEQIHIGDMVIANGDARDLAEFDQIIAEVRSRGAAASSNSYLQAIVQSSEKMSDAQAQARLRIPLAIFHAEQMRRTFDELNHALALWVGSSSSPRGTIERLVREDPQYIRLALDSDIQLYRWLVRQGEGDRTDLRSLVNHWRQIVAITTDVCRRVGCGPEASVVGAVKQTGPISVRRLVGESQWRRFLNWSESDQGGRFSFKLFLSPSDDLIDPRFHLVRAVDVGAGVKFKDKSEIYPLTRSSLVHPGIAYVSEKKGDYFKEFYPFSTKYDLSWNEKFDTESLRLRWSRNSDLSQRDFEGYGIYTAWELSVNRNDIRNAPEDVYINFAYQYQANEDVEPFSTRANISDIIANDVISLTGKETQQQGFRASDVELIAGSNDFCGKVSNVAKNLKQRNKDDLGTLEFEFVCENI